jgi:hypothetical protein
VPVAILPGGIDQAGNLAIGEVLAGADLGVTFASRGFGRSPTVPITVVGATSVRCEFVMIFRDLPVLCPEYGPSRDTAQGEKHRFYAHNFDLGAAAKPVSKQKTLNWQAFSVGGQPMPPQRWPAKGGNAQASADTYDCDSPRRFF